MSLSKIFQLYCGGLSLVKVTGIPGVKHWPAASHWQTLSYNGRVKQFDLLSFVVHVYICLSWSSVSAIF